MRRRTWRNDIEGRDDIEGLYVVILDVSSILLHSFTYSLVSTLLLVAESVPSAQILEEG